MDGLNRILLVANGHELEQHVLEQAGALADACDAELLTISDICANDQGSRRFASTNTGTFAVANEPELPLANGTRVRIEPGRTLADVIEAARSHDLIIKPAGKTTGPLSRAVAREDRELIRAGVCPVWIVKQPLPKRRRRVLAALEMDTTVEDSNFARAVLAHAAAISCFQQAALVVVNTWRIERELELRGRLNVTTLVGEMQHAQDKQLAALLREMPDLDEVDARSVNGAADRIVPEFVTSEGVHLVVTGSRTATGLGKLFGAGRAEERLLGRVSCSVLVLDETAANRVPEWTGTLQAANNRRDMPKSAYG